MDPLEKPNPIIDNNLRVDPIAFTIILVILIGFVLLMLFLFVTPYAPQVQG